MTRLLMTGASGFVGRFALAHLQKRDIEIHVAGRRAPDEPGRAIIHHIDLLEPTAITGLVRKLRPSHLLHFAWYAVPGRFWSARENLDWVAASMHLFRAFGDAGGQRIVGAGTCAEYDWRHSELREGTTPLRPTTLYGSAKLACSTVLDALAPLQTAWGRLFFLYGPHEQPGRLVSDVAAALVAGTPALCSHGRQERDFLHVDEAGRAFADLVFSSYCGAVNVASGTAVPIATLVGAMGRLAGRPDLIRLGARPAAESEPPRLAADVAVLREAVGFRSRIPLEEGLASTLEWWRKRGNDARGAVL